MIKLELARIVRFGTVGACVALIYGSLFLGLRRVGLSELSANGIAFGTGVTFQFVAQTLWTFRERITDLAQTLRFFSTIALGFAISSLATGVAAPHFGWPDWISASIVIFGLPVVNYITFRLWVFRGARD